MLEEKDYSKQELADALYAGNIKPASRMKKLWRELSGCPELMQNRANLRIAKARQEQALVAFNQTLLQSRLSLTADRFDLIQGKINLFKALGGEIGSK